MSVLTHKTHFAVVGIEIMVIAGWFVSYLLGCFPTGFVLAKFFLGYDITSKGSKNIGMTNMVRVSGKKWGILTLIGDFGKGVLAMLLFDFLNPSSADEYFLISGFFCVLGHTKNMFLKFKGGKGIATFFAVWLIFEHRFFLVMAITWILVFLITRISSLSALTMLFALSISVGIDQGLSPIFGLTIFCALYIFFLHRDNIRRILRGKEGALKK